MFAIRGSQIAQLAESGYTITESACDGFIGVASSHLQAASTIGQAEGDGACGIHIPIALGIHSLHGEGCVEAAR